MDVGQANRTERRRRKSTGNKKIKTDLVVAVGTTCSCFENRPYPLLFFAPLKALKLKASGRILVYRESRKPGKNRNKRTKFVRLIRADGQCLADSKVRLFSR